MAERLGLNGQLYACEEPVNPLKVLPNWHIGGG
jgi:hypothetical protein